MAQETLNYQLKTNGAVKKYAELALKLATLETKTAVIVTIN